MATRRRLNGRLGSKRRRNLHAAALLAALAFTTNLARAADPLPSWNDGAAKQSIIGFVEKVTTAGSPDFVPVSERIAVFDNDGTLWSEQPLPTQLYFARGLADVKLGAFTPALDKQAQKDGWTVISMKDDWKTVFPEAPSEITAIDILLKPDATMLEHAAANNERRLRIGGQPEVREDLLDHPRSSIVASSRSRPPQSGHARTSNAEDSAEQVSPREMAQAQVGRRAVGPSRRRARRALDDDRAAVAAPAWGEGAVVEEQVAPRARNDDRELLQKLGRLEADRPRAVAPRAAQVQQDFALGGQLQRVLGDGGTQDVSAQMFEPLALSGPHRGVGVQIEAFDMGVASAARGGQRRRGITPQA